MSKRQAQEIEYLGNYNASLRDRINQLITASFAEVVHTYVSDLVVALRGHEPNNNEQIFFDLTDGRLASYKAWMTPSSTGFGLSVALGVTLPRTIADDSNDLISNLHFHLTTQPGLHGFGANQTHVPIDIDVSGLELAQEFEDQERLGLSVPSIVDHKNLFELLTALADAKIYI